MGHGFLIHRRDDHVGVATSDLEAGATVVGVYMDDDGTTEVPANYPVPLGHKIAVEAVAEGEPVIEYGVPIGRATAPIARGDYVHTHNLKSARW